jgi:transposase
LRNVGQLIAMVRDGEDTRLPDVARQVLQVLACQLEQIEAAVTALERQLLAWHKTNPVSQRLASIPGIGPIIATAIATTVTDPNVFRSGQALARASQTLPNGCAVQADARCDVAELLCDLHREHRLDIRTTLLQRVASETRPSRRSF